MGQSWVSHGPVMGHARETELLSVIIGACRRLLGDFTEGHGAVMVSAIIGAHRQLPSIAPSLIGTDL